MAGSFELESTRGVEIGVVRGSFRLGEMKEIAAAMWRKVQADDARILWDLRDARFTMDPHEVRELAAFVKQQARPGEHRIAFVTGTDLEFGLIRMFEVFREAKDVQTAVFRSREAAVDWLTGAGAPPIDS